jgi:hypothetical protein
VNRLNNDAKAVALAMQKPAVQPGVAGVTRWSRWLSFLPLDDAARPAGDTEGLFEYQRDAGTRVLCVLRREAEAAAALPHSGSAQCAALLWLAVAVVRGPPPTGTAVLPAAAIGAVCGEGNRLAATRGFMAHPGFAAAVLRGLPGPRWAEVRARWARQRAVFAPPAPLCAVSPRVAEFCKS